MVQPRSNPQCEDKHNSTNLPTHIHTTHIPDHRGKIRGRKISSSELSLYGSCGYVRKVVKTAPDHVCRWVFWGPGRHKPVLVLTPAAAPALRVAESVNSATGGSTHGCVCQRIGMRWAGCTGTLRGRSAWAVIMDLGLSDSLDFLSCGRDHGSFKTFFGSFDGREK